jgi:ketosteroid isomerase-like protein
VARLALPICLLALIVAGCGGDDGDDKTRAEQTVRDFVKAVNTHDADAYCDDLITKEFREKTTFAKGDRASESCKREFRAIRGLRLRLDRIVRTKVDGDSATAIVRIGRAGAVTRQRIELEKEDGDWKIAGGAGG